MRGTEDLRGGNKAVFRLESGFSPDSGVANQGNRLFRRQALVGLSGQRGLISVGRLYTMLFCAQPDTEMLGPNVFGSGSLDSYVALVEGGLVYRLPWTMDAIGFAPPPMAMSMAGSACHPRTMSLALTFPQSRLAPSIARPHS
ncbi:porin [Cupriavidus basilensis]|uniref:porin n=1 Tax=Cupriavidus basilensis TaxID=68895 RepID=UPI003F5B942C